MNQGNIEGLDRELEPLLSQLDGAVKDCPMVARVLEQGGQKLTGWIKRTAWDRSRERCLDLERQVSGRLKALSRLASTSKLLVLNSEISRCFSTCSTCRRENTLRLGKGSRFHCKLENTS
jgi:hypothetical protein